MVVVIKKILFTLIVSVQLMGNTMASELSINDKFKIIDVMNNYAKGIDTKDYDLFRSIFDNSVEVNIIYDPSFRSGEPVSFEGADEWVQSIHRGSPIGHFPSNRQFLSHNSSKLRHHSVQ